MGLADKLIQRLGEQAETLAELRRLEEKHRGRIYDLERKLGDAEREQHKLVAEIETLRQERDLAQAGADNLRFSADSLRKDRDHWKESRQQAIEAGELMRAEIETLRQENGTLRKDFVTLQWIVEHMKKMAGGVSTRDADGCIIAVGQIQKWFDAAEYPLCNPQQKGGE